MATTIQQREAVLRSVFTKHVTIQQFLVKNPEMIDHPDFKTYSLYMADNGEPMEQAHMKAVRDELSGTYGDHEALFKALNTVSRGQNDLIKRSEQYIRKKAAFHAANNPPRSEVPTGDPAVPGLPEPVQP